MISFTVVRVEGEFAAEPMSALAESAEGGSPVKTCTYFSRGRASSLVASFVLSTFVGAGVADVLSADGDGVETSSSSAV
jgi:hypothetical protein